MTPATPNPSSLRADQVAGTRDAIVGAARRLFGRDGYGPTSIDAIAAEARVTKGAVYHHFSSKRDLFRAVHVIVEEEAQRRATTRPPRQGTTMDAVARGASAYLDAVLDPETQRITLLDAPSVLGGDLDLQAGEDPGHSALRHALEAAIHRGDVAKVDADATAHLIRGACLQAALYIAHADDSAAARRRIGPVLDRMIRGLAGGASPP